MINKQSIATLLGSWFGVGFSRVAPGTMGALAALPFAALLYYMGGTWGLLLAAIALFAVGVWACEVYVRATGKDDPSEMVIDEVAAQWLVLAFLPFTPEGYFLGFLFFRLFDVWKPFPINIADNLIHGGLGVMLDDMLAALYAIIASLGCLIYVLPRITLPSF